MGSQCCSHQFENELVINEYDPEAKQNLPQEETQKSQIYTPLITNEATKNKTIDNNLVIKENQQMNENKKVELDILDTPVEQLAQNQDLVKATLKIQKKVKKVDPKLVEERTYSLILKTYTETSRPMLNDQIVSKLNSLSPYNNTTQISSSEIFYFYNYLLLQNGNVYKGDWHCSGIPQGSGILYFPTGSVYEGQIKNGKCDGSGRQIMPNGDVYEGCWKRGQKSGDGTETFFDGTLYNGNFNADVKNGKGKLQLPDGSSYEGEFINNKMEGNGIYKWIDQRQYNGQFKENQMDGEGQSIYPDGKIYKGSFQKDQMHGAGEMKFPSGIIYQGNWNNGKQEGKGIMINEKNEKRSGQWTNGKLVKWFD